MKTSLIRLAIGIIGDLAAGSMLLAPCKTFYRIIGPGGSKSVEQCTPYPFLFTLLNSIAFLFYGLVSPMARLSTLIVNGIGIVAEGAYCGTYIWFAVGKNRAIAFAMVAANVLVAGGLLTVHFTIISHSHHRAAGNRFLGIFGAVTGVLMYFAPVRDLVAVIQSHDVSRMNIVLASTSLLNGIIWIIYASIHPVDVYILVPSVAGVVSAMAEIYVFLVPQGGALGAWLHTYLKVQQR